MVITSEAGCERGMTGVSAWACVHSVSSIVIIKHGYICRSSSSTMR